MKQQRSNSDGTLICGSFLLKGQKTGRSLISWYNGSWGVNVTSKHHFSRGFDITTAFGDQIQMFALAFRVDRWQGAVVASTDETTHARFFAPDKLPLDLPALYRETLADLEHYEQTGQFILK